MCWIQDLHHTNNLIYKYFPDISNIIVPYYFTRILVVNSTIDSDFICKFYHPSKLPGILIIHGCLMIWINLFLIFSEPHIPICAYM